MAHSYGYLLEAKEVVGHVANSRERERDDRSQAGKASKKHRDEWLAEAPADHGQAGLCFPKAEGGGVCGWLFLARVPPLF